MIHLTVPKYFEGECELEPGERVDQFLARLIPGISRSQLAARILLLRINEQEAKLSRKLAQADRVYAELSDPEPSMLEPEALPLDVIYEDQDVIVINKKRGMLVHPGAGNPRGSVAAALLHRGLEPEGFPAQDRPGIVHRLDKETSGVLIAARNAQTHEYLSSQFRRRETGKVYIAVSRVMRSPALDIRNFPLRIENRLARDPVNRMKYRGLPGDGDQGKLAISVLKLMGLSAGANFAVLRISIETGRTHQIRVHLSELGLPVLGDSLYGTREDREAGQAMLLHAQVLELRLREGEEVRRFEAAIPADISEFIRAHRIAPIPDA